MTVTYIQRIIQKLGTYMNVQSKTLEMDGTITSEINALGGINRLDIAGKRLGNVTLQMIETI